MHTIHYLRVVVTYLMLTTGVCAQNANAVHGASPLIPIDNEAPARLIVDPPVPEALARGGVLIQYRTENLRVMPVFGKSALGVSPRIGHVHITVDAAAWHFIDASGNTVVLAGLEPGPHRVLFELADTAHQVIASETVTFTVPTPAMAVPHK